MKLLEHYLTLDSGQKKALAREIGSEVSYLRHLAYGRKQPSHSLAKKIETATNKQVTRSDLRPDIYPPEEFQE
ncbi:transcriptional regulator [Endozoicomonas lisbonensis]|uniref:DNA-binding transcriptional regulator YdaS (Cro superfamily) n=1 Tax=Endozoicomonas lisbonensis TaxID=3120522 RepID=A0ABV2SFL1_9GAMM